MAAIEYWAEKRKRVAGPKGFRAAENEIRVLRICIQTKKEIEFRTIFGIFSKYLNLEFESKGF
jgi:hypothetical protein